MSNVLLKESIGIIVLSRKNTVLESFDFCEGLRGVCEGFARGFILLLFIYNIIIQGITIFLLQTPRKKNIS